MSYASNPVLNKHAGRLHWYHWLILSLSLLLTIAAWYISNRQVNERIASQFHREAEQIVELISERMQKYEDALWAGVAAIHSQSHGIDYQEWKRFADTLHIEQKYPGINGIGVIERISTKRLTSYLTEQRKDRPDFSIRPEHDRGEFWPISYVEPIETNRQAVGLDIAHETNRFEAATKARDTAKAQITGPITLVQDAAKTPGFLFYAPFYKRDTGDSLAERQKGFVGMVYAPFIVHKLMEGTLEKDKRHIGIQIRDGQQVLYDEHQTREDDFDIDPLFKRQFSIEMYGRNWQFDIRSALSFRAAANHNQPMSILVAGLLIEGLLLWLFINMSRANQRAVALARNITHDMNEMSHILEDSLNEIYIFDAETLKFLHVNKGALKNIGYRKDEMLEMTPINITPDFGEKHFRDMLRPLLKWEQDKLIFRTHHTRKDSSRYDVEAHLQLSTFNDSTVFVAIILDISEQMKILEKVRQNEADLQLIFDNVPAMIWHKDDENNILRLNQKAAESMGGRVAEFEGKNTYDLFPEMAKKYHNDDLQVINSGEPLIGIIEEYTPKNADHGWVRTDKMPYIDAKTNKRSLFVISQDITAFKKAGQALEEYAKHLERSNQDLDDFAYIASHDLKEPLRGIYNHSSMLMRDYGQKMETEDQRKLDRVIYLAKRMESLINDLLLFSRMGRSEVTMQDNDLQAIAEQVRKTTLATDDDGITITIHGPLPHVVCDRVKVTELFRNLITNGLKYNECDKKVIEIGTTSGKDGESENIIYIKDNGIGIDSKFHTDIFKIFRRLHKKEEFGGGTGSGLTFVKKIIERHNGRVWVESTLGEGTTFFFTLQGASECDEHE